MRKYLLISVLYHEPAMYWTPTSLKSHGRRRNQYQAKSCANVTLKNQARISFLAALSLTLAVNVITSLVL